MRFYSLKGNTMEHLRKYIHGDLSEFISINSERRFGKPCIRETRMGVCDILEFLAADQTIEQFLAEFPGFTRNDVLAALAFGARVTGSEGEMRVPPVWDDVVDQ